MPQRSSLCVAERRLGFNPLRAAGVSTNTEADDRDGCVWPAHSPATLPAALPAWPAAVRAAAATGAELSNRCITGEALRAHGATAEPRDATCWREAILLADVRTLTSRLRQV